MEIDGASGHPRDASDNLGGGQLVSSLPKDARMHCSLCDFRFWQSRTIFYLVRQDQRRARQPMNEWRAQSTEAQPAEGSKVETRYFFSGENYRFDFDQHGWHPISQQNGVLQYGWEDRSADFSLFGDRPKPVEEHPRYPICWDCFRVLREFLTARNKHPRQSPSITSLAKLYRVFDARWVLTQWNSDWRDWDEPVFRLVWPHEAYHGPFRAYDRFRPPRLIAPRATQERMEDWTWLLMNPYRPLPSLTDFLLKHLQPTAETEQHESTPDFGANNVPRHSQSDSHLLQLPQEVLSNITCYLDAQSCFAMRMTCVRLAAAIPLDQRFWYDKFMQHDLFGFFFNFDIIKVIDETRRKCEKRGRLPPDWDWKRLVRELACFSSFQNGGSMADAPGAFRNRRRIWKILEVAETLHRDELMSDERGM